jgi:hypothetical protein
VSNILGEQKATISVKEAKKILGREIKNYSDEEIEKLVQDMVDIAGLYIRSVQRAY